jgi:hypothetical protein
MLEKYSCFKDDCVLKVSFQIEEEKANSVPKLKCWIIYEKEKFSSGGYEFFASASTPEYALEQFDIQIQKKSGVMLKNRVSVDLTEEIIKDESEEV